MDNPCVLIADDSRAIQVSLNHTLTQAGFEVHVAGDGLQAVEMARDEKPDLVILDIQMPVLDGYEACDQILQHSTLPVIFLTKNNASHLSVLGEQLGAYLQKPVDPDHLIETVQDLLAAC